MHKQISLAILREHPFPLTAHMTFSWFFATEGKIYTPDDKSHFLPYHLEDTQHFLSVQDKHLETLTVAPSFYSNATPPIYSTPYLVDATHVFQDVCMAALETICPNLDALESCVLLLLRDTIKEQYSMGIRKTKTGYAAYTYLRDKGLDKFFTLNETSLPALFDKINAHTLTYQGNAYKGVAFILPSTSNQPATSTSWIPSLTNWIPSPVSVLPSTNCVVQ